MRTRIPNRLLVKQGGEEKSDVSGFGQASRAVDEVCF